MKVPDHMWIAGGAPTEIALEINFEMVLSGELRERFETECRDRRMQPASLMARIIELVIRDDLFEAVIGE